MKIIWIDGTFGIGKSAVAAAIVKKIPQAHLLELYGLRVRLSEHIGKLPLGYLNNTSIGSIKKTMPEAHARQTMDQLLFSDAIQAYRPDHP